MLAEIKWNSRRSTREWVMIAMARVIRAQANLRSGEGKQRQPLWKHFDDSHHWDATAEEWVPNLDR
ncbi:hypothetical protein I3J27_14130 [Bradyrhizobium xenonodulans]|uniref:Transposase n=1 Tax=Bradyrhizobium xenonodulans TaxID=2736875 RepID=A0ABY7MU92_9BRAD|nr:hypothetical protein [Bradyrhizobium xenonodulans]WBL81496.1 hypothetical protein I3J27_14130 [Bradyrhizobium xenonodulans]